MLLMCYFYNVISSLHLLLVAKQSAMGPDLEKDVYLESDFQRPDDSFYWLQFEASVGCL